MKAPAKRLIADLEALGYEYDRTNAKNFQVFACGGQPDILVNPSLNEHAARAILRKAQQRLGCVPETNKRKPEQIRVRQEAQRTALREEIERHNVRLDVLRRQSYGFPDSVTSTEIRQIEALVRKREQELHEIERLMTSGPLGNSARHRAGER